MNSILRTIGLTTYMVAPAVAGLLFQHIGYIWTGACIAGWNVTSAIVEFAILANIYKYDDDVNAVLSMRIFIQLCAIRVLFF